MLSEAGYEVILNPYGRSIKPDELGGLAQGIVGVVAGTEQWDRVAIDGADKLRVISRCGVGMDNVDKGTAAERGIAVCNTPDGPTLAVAELTIGLTLDLLRRVSAMDRELRTGVWNKVMGYLLFGKKVGIVGMGRIGRSVARLFEPFGVTIAYSDIVEADVPYERKEYAALLGWADIVTFHISGSKQLLSEKELSVMSPGTFLLNVARGGIVDEMALLAAIQSGHIGGAALDVFESEPYEGPFVNEENVILTPHIGSYAREARISMEISAVENLLKELA